jgi:hypothetical protein
LIHIKDFIETGAGTLPMRSEVASTASSHGKISSMDLPRHVAELAVVDVTAEIRKAASGS